MRDADSSRRLASQRARSSDEGADVLSGRIPQCGSAERRGAADATPLAVSRAMPRATDTRDFFTTASSNLTAGLDEGVGERSPMYLCA
jgi:hypothetical protein